MRTITFIQFLLPDGRKQLVNADVPDKIAEMAQGQKITTEMLRTGEIAIYSHRIDEEENEAVEIVENKPGEPVKALIALIKRVHEGV